MIVAVGDIMLDVMMLSELREAEQSRGILLRGGGSAANTASWIAHLGEQAACVCAVGIDPVGSMLVTELNALHVRPVVRITNQAETGTVAIEVSGDGERIMRSARGANMCLQPSDVLGAAGLRPRAIHLSGYALLCPDGIGLLEAAAEVARECGAILSFDPSSPTLISHIGPKKLLAALTRCDVRLLLPNREEGEALSGEALAVEGARSLAGSFSTVMVKDDARGAAYCSGSESGCMPVTSVLPIDSTGAGDAFDAGVLVGMVRGNSIAEACRSGNETAGQAISAYGGRPRHG
ncbi:MAG: carbohydrate kinase family protein [Chloroflexota bacterium]